MEEQKSHMAKQKRKRGLWSPEEDRKLYNYITTFGVDSWSSLPKQAGLDRCEKSCRLRWVNHLDPNLKKSPISPEEERRIISLHNVLGNSGWSKIAESLPGRTDNEIKNFWNCHMKKKIRMLDISKGSNESSSSGASIQGTPQISEYLVSSPHIKDCKSKSKMQTHEMKDKFKASNLPYYDHTVMSCTSQNGTHNLSSSSAQLTAEGMDHMMKLRDYMNSLAILINFDGNGSNVRDGSIDEVMYF